MIYLKSFNFPQRQIEDGFLTKIMRTCYDTYYPFQIFPNKNLKSLEFKDITILYGSNGSGKSTLLNIMSEKLKIQRKTLYNRSNFLDDYLKFCSFEMYNLPDELNIITSDEVFDFMLDLRSLNERINIKREDLFEEYYKRKNSNFTLSSLDDYEELKKNYCANKNSQSKYIRKNLMNNTREYSNGESAFLYFQNKIRENGLYFLDEPENSLSPRKQIELLEFLEESVRFFNIQLIIATHSPFILSLKNAKIYSLDERVEEKDWTELENVRIYYEFFKRHEEEFK